MIDIRHGLARAALVGLFLATAAARGQPSDPATDSAPPQAAQTTAASQHDTAAPNEDVPLSGNEEPAGAPKSQLVATPPTGTAGSATSQSGQRAPADLVPAGVVVGELGRVDGPVVGTLDDSNGGLGSQMWSGADRRHLESELSRIPVVTTDPVIRELARRLLLTKSEAPAGAAGRALVTIRLERLLDAGFIDEAGEIARTADVPNDPEFARVQAESLLYAGLAESCGKQTSTRLTGAETFWLELRAVCYAEAGDFPAAELTRSVIDAEGTNDVSFAVLLDDLEKKQGVPPGDFAHPTAVDIYLLRKLGLPVTASTAAQLGTPADVLAALDKRNDPDERLRAAEHIVRTGALGNQLLVQIADAQAFSAEERSSRGTGLQFFARQSLIHQLAMLEPRPLDRLAMVESADPSRVGDGPFHVFAALEAPVLALMPPVTTDAKGAWIAARTLILGEKAHSAVSWIGAPDNPLTAESALAIDLAAPAAAQDAGAQVALLWFASHPTEELGGWPAAGALAEGLWRALGLSGPQREAIQSTVAADAPAPAVPTFDGAELSEDTKQAIDEAAANPARRGEALLLLVDAIGSRGPARFAPDADIYIVSKLEELRLDDFARRFAVECLLLGPPRPARRPVAATPGSVSQSPPRAQ